MTDTIFPDISEHQAKADLAQVRQVTEGIGVRVCYGQRLDLCMPFRRDEVHRNRFKAVLWYLFLRAHQDVAAQVATFTHCIPSLAYGEAAMVDYESDPYDNNAWPTEAQRDQAQRLLDAHYGRRAGTYASGLVAIPQDRVRWIADYEVAKPHTTYDIWQYTDGYYTSGRYAPVDWPTIGKRDTNVFHGTADQLAQLLSPTGDDDVIDPKLFKKVVPCPDQSVAQNGRQARWVLTLDGGVFPADGAPMFGSYWNLSENERQGQRQFVDLVPVGPKNEDGYWLYGADDSAYGPFNPALWARIQPKP